MTYPLAFVILSHKHPEQVRRLASRLEPYPLLVHVDARSSTKVWQLIARLEAEENVHMLPRFPTSWGSWGLVEAALSGLGLALEIGCEQIVICTGQDYPLRPAAEIASYFAARRGTSWIYNSSVPVSNGMIGDRDGGVGRFRWHVTVRGRHLRAPLSRPMPAGLQPHYGSAQCCLSAPLGRWVLEQISQRAELRRFFRHVQLPDELLLPTLAMSSPLRETIETCSLWYMDWSLGGAHPKVLADVDYDRLAAASRGPSDVGGPAPVKLFARKFEPAVSDGVLERIDTELLSLKRT